MRTIILHYHLFKNAGTSVDQLLKRNFDTAWVTKEFPIPNSPQGNTPQVEDWIRENPDAVAFSSHTMAGPLPVVEGVRIVSIMLLRDPIKRIVSAYAFERTQGVSTFGSTLARHTDLEGYVRVRLSIPNDRQCHDFQCARLARMLPGPEDEFDRAKDALGKLTVSGLVEKFSIAMSNLAEELRPDFPEFSWEEVRSNTSKSTKSTKQISHSPEFLELLRKSNKNDIALIEGIKEENGWADQ